MFCALSLSKFVTVEGHHYHYHLRDLLFLVILNLVESLLSSNIIHDRISRVVEPIEYCLLGRISLFFLVPSVNSITSFRCLSVRPSIAYNHEYHIFFPPPTSPTKPPIIKYCTLRVVSETILAVMGKRSPSPFPSV